MAAKASWHRNYVTVALYIRKVVPLAGGVNINIFSQSTVLLQYSDDLTILSFLVF